MSKIKIDMGGYPIDVLVGNGISGFAQIIPVLISWIPKIRRIENKSYIHKNHR